MTDYKSVALGKIGDTPLTLDDLLFQLKTNLDQQIIDDTVHAVMLKKVAADLDVAVAETELQQAADNFRLAAGLVSAAETMEWLGENGLSVDEFERKLENDLLREKVQAKVCTEEKINRIFAENILEFEKATIGQIVVKEAGLAEEIRAQIDEGEADFATLAGKYSLDGESAARGGYVGDVSRNDLPDEVDLEVFGDGASELIGPVKAGAGFYIVRVLAPKKADPADPVTRACCIRLLFEDYMAEKGQEMGVKLDFLP